MNYTAPKPIMLVRCDLRHLTPGGCLMRVAQCIWNIAYNSNNTGRFDAGIFSCYNEHRSSLYTCYKCTLNIAPPRIHTGLAYNNAKHKGWFNQPWLPQLQFKTTILYYTVKVYGKLLQAIPIVSFLRGSIIISSLLAQCACLHPSTKWLL